MLDTKSFFREPYKHVDKLTERLKAMLNAEADYIDLYKNQFLFARLFHDYALDGTVITADEIKVTFELSKTVELEDTLPNENLGKSQSQHKLPLPDNYHSILFLTDLFEEINEISKNLDFKPNLATIRKFHSALTRHMSDTPSGKFRQEIPIHRTYFHTIAQPENILFDLTELFEKINSRNFNVAHPVKQSAIIHQGFIKVFPFKEFSGVIGRLLANYYLQRAGYFPVVIHSSDRQQYFEAIKEGEEELEKITIGSMINSIQSSVKFLEELSPRQVLEW